MKFKPVIKWSGSKRSQSEQIVSHFPKIIKTYYEPFCGSCSVLYQLLNTPDIKVDRYVCSDINNDLIGLWEIIQKCPLQLYENYYIKWNELNSLPNIESKNNYYYDIRNRFNKYRNPCLFFFLIRTCFNGLIRYNKKLEFNSPFHIGRPGIQPDKIKDIIFQWSEKIQNVEFKCCSYIDIQPLDNEDFMYLDSPYFSTKAMYNGKIDYNEYWNWLRKQKCDYVFNFDGINGKDNTYNVPKNLYDKHLYLDKELSSYSRLNKEKIYVRESLYIKYNIL